MKKSVLKVLSVITALCLFLGAMPTFVFAEGDIVLSSDGEKVIYFSPETELPLEFGGNVNRFYSSGTEVDATRYFYSQLTDSQKGLYDQIKAAGPVESIAIDMSNITITGTGSSKSTAQSALVSNITQDVMMALTALSEDYPLFFWLSGFSWNNAYLSYTLSNGVYTAKLGSLNVVVSLDTTHFSDYSDVQVKYDAIIEKLNSIKVNGISYHEKLKSIHDYLADNITYDSTLSEPNIYDPYGALVTGVCVCEGYAEATKLLCDREGIPCITVVGTGNGGAHKWNYIQMDDNEWYVYDVTWDDQGSNTFYSYFLIGSDTKAPYFGTQSDADSTIHIPTGKIFSNASKTLTYPTLSTDTYSIGVIRYDAPDINVDKTRGVILVGKGITNYYTYFVSNSTTGHTRAKSSSGTTGSTLKLGDGVSTLTYLVAMRGDVNKSNTVDTDDYSLLTQICVTTDTVTDASVNFYAGDMNQDGAVDGFDAVALDLYINDQLIFD